MSKFRINMNGKVYEMEIERIDGEAAEVKPAAKPEAAAKPVAPAAPAAPAKAAPKAQPAAGSASVTSPMPGTILRVVAAEGQTVGAGETVLVLEAMKMENEIQAPKAGKIVGLAVAAGQTVASGELLFSVE